MNIIFFKKVLGVVRIVALCRNRNTMHLMCHVGMVWIVQLQHAMVY
jgi:hypothetical protein